MAAACVRVMPLLALALTLDAPCEIISTCTPKESRTSNTTAMTLEDSWTLAISVTMERPPCKCQRGTKKHDDDARDRACLCKSGERKGAIDADARGASGD